MLLKKTSLDAFIFLGLIILTLLVIIAGCEIAAEEVKAEQVEEITGENRPLIQPVVLKGQVFFMELAFTPEQRSRGLMGRDYLDDNEGMLFVFPPVYPYPRELFFWMKGCLIPIDLLFLNNEGVVIAIHEMQPPCPGTPDEELALYSSLLPAQFALELRGGLVSALGIEVGYSVNVPFEQLLEMAE